jgi:hypothetical protein
MPRDGSEDDRRKLDAIKQEQWRRICRRDVAQCATEMLAPFSYQPAAHHRLLCTKLQALANGKLEHAGRQCFRLMVTAPPGAAKSSYVSRIYVAWFFATRPGSRVIGVSHIDEFAERNSAEAAVYQGARRAVGLWAGE